MKEEEWKQMTPIEQLMLLQNDPHNPMCFIVIIGLSINPSVEWLCANLLPRLLRHPRFASVVVKDRTGTWRFEKLPEFAQTASTAENHIEMQMPIQSDKPNDLRYKEFITRVNSIISTSLPLDRPLWSVHVIPRYSLDCSSTTNTCATPNEECCTLIFKMHHSVTDGIGMLKFLTAEMIDGATPENPPSLLVVPARQRNHISKRNTQDPKDKTANRSNLDDQSKIIPNPSVMASALAHRTVCAVISDVCTDVYKTLVKPLFPDPDTVLTRGNIMGQKRCALTAPGTFTVKQLREAGKRLGVTVNDLIYTAVSAGTSAYVKMHGDSGRKLKKMHCVIAINRTMLDAYQPSDVSNQFALLVTPLHVDAQDSSERLRCCVKTISRLKRGVQAALAIKVFQIVQWIPLFARRPFWRYLSRSTSITYSNLPGPIHPVSVAGVPVNYMQFFGPSDGHLGATFSAFSYNNDIFLGMQTDENRVSDPERYIDLIKIELENLIQLSTKN